MSLAAKSGFMVGILTKSMGGLPKKEDVVSVKQDGSRYCPAQNPLYGSLSLNLLS